LRLLQPLAHFLDAARDLRIGLGERLLIGAANHAVRETDAILQPIVTDFTGGFRHLARRIAFVAAGIARGAIELVLQLGQLLADLIPPLDHLPGRLLPAGA
jgi:hypothetical protein